MISILSKAATWSPEQPFGEAFSRVFSSRLCSAQLIWTAVISDTGTGIEKEKQRLIFQSFAQADGSITRQYGGTGLGLAICRQLVGLMGGRIWVESEPGQGSKFHFTALLKRPKAVSAPATATLFDGTRAMVVDQDQDDRQALAAMLDCRQVETAVLSGGPAALEVLRWSWKMGRPFSVILMDEGVLAEEGGSIIDELKQDPALAAIPIVLTTGQCLDEAQHSEMRIASSLVKPISQSRLLECLMKVLPQSAESEAGGTSAERSGDDKAPRLRILVAEDVAENQLLIEALLRQQGHSFFITSNGREALDAFKKEKFDLALLDLQMPIMGGLEAASLIREEEELTDRRTPIIALTAHAMKGDRERCLDAGMDGYVSKPIDRRLLYDTIRRLSPTTTGA